MVDQFKDLADNRLVNGCIYCRSIIDDTRDHVPSRIFLDHPLPENLPVVGACKACNNGFSLDEEYVACVIESVIAGSTDPDRMRRPKIADILRRNPSLRARLDAAKNIENDQVQFGVEPERIKNIILKLARGHAAFELSQICDEEPAFVWWYPFPLLTEEQRDAFDSCQFVELLGEVGSRGQQRLMVFQLELKSESGERHALPFLVNDWVEVQEERYRYIAIHESNEIRIKIIIGDYLACEIAWAGQ